MLTGMEKHFWFLDSLTTIPISVLDGKNALSVIEQHAPKGDSPPLHVHRTQDEIFHILEGEFLVKIGKHEHQLKAGDILLAPMGIPHTYRIESEQGGRWLSITVGSNFEDFVRAMSRPAEHPGFPQSDGLQSPEAVETLTAIAKEYGIDIVGPPLH
jgi:quercetin dioxygenase-like cupin family protein